MKQFLAIASALCGTTALAMSCAVLVGSWTANDRELVASLLVAPLILSPGAIFTAILLIVKFARRAWWAWLLLVVGVSSIAVNYHAFGVA